MPAGLWYLNSVPWLLLAFGIWGLGLALNAVNPSRRFGAFAVPSFFASWLTAELALHNFVLQLVFVLGFIWLGGLEGLPGWIGLGFQVVAWMLMFRMVVISSQTRDAFESAFDESLGPGNWLVDPLRTRRSRKQLLVPLWLRDRQVKRIGNVAFTTNGHPRQRLDIYVPRGGVTQAPVILQVHGGGWVLGNKRQQGMPLMLHMASRGYVCVATNYRLSPAATFPEQIIDIKLAIAWVRQHIGAYGGDPEQIIITGGSAGGHLSSLAALTPGYRPFQPGFEDADTSVHACIPFYGVYDFTNSLGTHPGFGLLWLLEQFVMKRRLAADPGAFEQASPLFHVHANAPPFFVIHGDQDSLAPVVDARAFVAALRRVSQQPVVYAELPGAQHAFDVFHSIRTADAIRAVECFVRQVTRGPC